MSYHSGSARRTTTPIITAELKRHADATLRVASAMFEIAVGARAVQAATGDARDHRPRPTKAPAVIQPHVPAGSAAWSYTSSVSETRASASPSPKPPVLPAFSLLDQKSEVNLTMAATPQSLSGLDRSPQLAP